MRFYRSQPQATPLRIRRRRLKVAEYSRRAIGHQERRALNEYIRRGLIEIMMKFCNMPSFISLESYFTAARDQRYCFISEVTLPARLPSMSWHDEMPKIRSLCVNDARRNGESSFS